jgi:hypothetical protein
VKAGEQVKTGEEKMIIKVWMYAKYFWKEKSQYQERYLQLGIADPGGSKFFLCFPSKETLFM